MVAIADNIAQHDSFSVANGCTLISFINVRCTVGMAFVHTLDHCSRKYASEAKQMVHIDIEITTAMISKQIFAIWQFHVETYTIFTF